MHYTDDPEKKVYLYSRINHYKDYRDRLAISLIIEKISGVILKVFILNLNQL